MAKEKLFASLGIMVLSMLLLVTATLAWFTFKNDARINVCN